jgi:elongation factor 3
MFVRRVPRAKTYYELSEENLSFSFPGTEFTCFTGTKVQILTQKALLEPGLLDGVKSKGKAIIKMDKCTYQYPTKVLALLALLALLVQKYKY